MSLNHEDAENLKAFDLDKFCPNFSRTSNVKLADEH
jgi:hypothetical protein